MLVDRRTERSALDSLIVSARGGLGSALVLRGEPGIGKTALLEYAIESASGFRIARAGGVESEMELAFAALHQVCAPVLDRLERLPGPQREALGVAFGLRAGAAPDRFLVGLAVLNLLSEVAGSGRCCAWWMMRSGWTGPRRRRWRSRRGGCWPTRSR
jgi:hypothetical protein